MWRQSPDSLSLEKIGRPGKRLSRKYVQIMHVTFFSFNSLTLLSIFAPDPDPSGAPPYCISQWGQCWHHLHWLRHSLPACGGDWPSPGELLCSHHGNRLCPAPEWAGVEGVQRYNLRGCIFGGTSKLLCLLEQHHTRGGRYVRMYPSK